MRTVAGVAVACFLICSAAFVASIAARRRLNSDTPRAARVQLLLSAVMQLALAFVLLLNTIPTLFGLSAGAVEVAFWSTSGFALLLGFAQIYVVAARNPHISGSMGPPIPMALHTWIYGDEASQEAADGQNSSLEQE